MKRERALTRRIVFVCIGTPRIEGDSIGPRVGSMLRNKGVKAFVYGTLEKPITAINLHLYRKMLSVYHRGDVIVAIDAAMGNLEDIGRVKLSEKGLRPAGAFRRNSALLGDAGILAVVGENDGDRMAQLKACDPGFSEKMAEKICSAVIKGIFRSEECSPEYGAKGSEKRFFA